jgi:hypothetical protein
MPEAEVKGSIAVGAVMAGSYEGIRADYTNGELLF